MNARQKGGKLKARIRSRTAVRGSFKTTKPKNLHSKRTRKDKRNRKAIEKNVQEAAHLQASFSFQRAIKDLEIAA